MVHTDLSSVQREAEKGGYLLAVSEPAWMSDSALGGLDVRFVSCDTREQHGSSPRPTPGDVDSSPRPTWPTVLPAVIACLTSSPV